MEKICKEDDCINPVLAKGWCRAHYNKQRRVIRKALSDPCSLEGCTEPSVCKTLCDKHYTRLKRHGNPNIRWSKGIKSDAERCWEKVDKSPNELGCWLWTGTVNLRYGKFKSVTANYNYKAQRFSYAWLNGVKL